MAGHARFTAVLDACVLFPIATADALLSLAAADLYAAKWTTAIDAEWIAAGERLRPELTGKLLVRRDAMHEAGRLMRRAGRPWRRPLPFPTPTTTTCWPPRSPATRIAS